MKLHDLAKKERKPSQEIGELFYTRWSPRAMTGEEMSKEELLHLFEAARWAPSSRNEQPWRFVVGIGDDKEKFMEFLVDFNKQWCENATALVVILSHKNFEQNKLPNNNHSFDVGAAWQNLALEGARRGLVVHGMAGILPDKIRKVLQIPEDYQIEAMCAIGKLANKSTLSEELKEREVPSQRKKLNEIISWGELRFD